MAKHLSISAFLLAGLFSGSVYADGAMQVKIQYMIHGKCDHLGSLIGLGEWFEASAHIFETDPGSGVTKEIKDFGRNILWTVDGQEVSSYPATHFENSLTLGRSFVFGTSGAEIFDQSLLTIAATDILTDTVAFIQLKQVKESGISCN